MAARPVFDSRLLLLRIAASKLSYKQLVQIGNSVVAGITSAVGLYPTPTPALATAVTAITDLKNALALNGTKHNKGSAANLVDTKYKANVVKGIIVQLLAYVNNTVVVTGGTPEQQASNLAISGFGTRSVRSKIPLMAAPTALHIANSKKYPPTSFILRWKKPINTIKGVRPSAYLVTVTPVVAGPPVITAIVTKGLYQVPAGPDVIVSVQALNAQGLGNTARITVLGHSFT